MDASHLHRSGLKKKRAPMAYQYLFGFLNKCFKVQYKSLSTRQYVYIKSYHDEQNRCDWYLFISYYRILQFSRQKITSTESMVTHQMK
jgi:hypothetical protein